jgi:radical SAM-linked protein
VPGRHSPERAGDEKHFSTRRGVAPGLTESDSFSKGITKGLRNRLAIRFAVEGDLRFISHHDTLRFFERALARAGIPVRYSEGYSPRPRLSIVLPRPVGVASCDECIVLELDSHQPPEEVLSRLKPHLPRGLALRSAEALPETDHRRPCEAEYVVDVPPDAREDLGRRAAALMAAPRLEVRRRGGTGAPDKTVDIRPYVRAVTLEGTALAWRQSTGQEGTARVGEVLEALGLPARDHVHRVVRRRVEYRA